MGKGYLLARDGSRHDNFSDLDAANARYDQQQRQNELLAEQNRLIKEQNKRAEEEKRLQENISRTSISSANSYTSPRELEMLGQQLDEFEKEDRLDKLRDLSTKVLKSKLNKKNEKLTNIKNKLKIVQVKEKPSISLVFFIPFEIVMIPLAILLVSPIMLGIAGLGIIMFVVMCIMDSKKKKSKIDELSEKFDMDKLEDLPNSSRELNVMKIELQQELYL